MTGTENSTMKKKEEIKIEKGGEITEEIAKYMLYL